MVPVRSTCPWAFGVLSVLLLAGAQTLYPPGCDGSWVRYSGDGWDYGEYLDRPTQSRPGQIFLEMGLDPARGNWFHPNHAGFQLGSWCIWQGLRHLPIPRPGHVAVRILAALGAVACLGLIISTVGPLHRPHAGWLLAAVLLSARGFWLHGLTGESILPSAAAGLWALRLALAETPPVRRLALAMGLAVFLRQDGILLIPGLVAAAWRNRATGLRILRWLMIAGAAVASYYGLAWASLGFVKSRAVLFGVALKGWDEPGAGPPLLRHLAGLGDAWVGRRVPGLDEALFSGGALTLGLLVAGSLLRGHLPLGRWWVFLAITVVVRGTFYTTFEPDNWEWQMVTLLMLIMGVAYGSAGWPTRSLFARRVGSAILLGLAATGVALHGPATWTLREHRHQAGFAAVRETVGPEVVRLTLDAMAVPAGEAVEQHESADTLVARATALAAAGHPSVVAMLNVHVLDGMPATLSIDRWATPFWQPFVDRDDVRSIFAGGKRVALVIPLAPR